MPTFIQQVALVSESPSIDLNEVTEVAAALDKQAARDFGPIWGVTASIHAFARLEDVPLGYWPMVVQDDIGIDGAAGIHLDRQGQPYALITSGDNWALTASHEACEILADPFGNRVVAGPSIKPGQGRVNYLVEVSDPSEAAAYGYSVNDILLSDFYTPNYFDPVAAPGVRYSFTGAITKPREVLPGGYLSWHEPVTDHWWQVKVNSAGSQFRDIGILDASNGSMRSQIDAISGAFTRSAQAPKKSILSLTAKKEKFASASSQARAKSLRAEFALLPKEQK